MEKAARIMYIIGCIFNIVAIVGIAIWLIICIVGVCNPDAIWSEMQKQADSPIKSLDELKAALTVMLIGACISLVIYITIFVLATTANKSIKNGSTSNAPHIIMIVIGALGADIFYLLGGIFGLVAVSQKQTSQSKKE